MFVFIEALSPQASGFLEVFGFLVVLLVLIPIAGHSVN